MHKILNLDELITAKHFEKEKNEECGDLNIE